MTDYDYAVERTSEQKNQPTNHLLKMLNRINMLVLVLLALTLLVGVYFRFQGQNWDDFTWLHPDERFLTVNLLPNVGGSLQFTPDADEYPDHVILTVLDRPLFRDQVGLIENASLRVGVVENTLAHNIARGMLSPARIQTYEHIEDAARGLAEGQINAIIALDTESLPYITVNAAVPPVAQKIESIPSIQVQHYNCRYLNPDTNGIGGYFDAACSPLNPHNASVGMYVYGTLPMFMAHFGGEFVQQTNPTQFQTGTLAWRWLSAFFDTLTILLVFLIGTRLHNKWTGLLAAVLYTAAPLAIEKAHFGTVNAITAFWVALAVLFAVSAQDRARWLYYIGFGAASGAAVAGRINTAPIVGLIILVAMIRCAPVLDTRLPWQDRQRILWHNIIGLMLSGIAAFLVFRIGNPYAFNGPGFFGLSLNPRWLKDVQAGSFGVSGLQESPPNYQWVGRPSYLYPLKDMLLWGMGIAFGVLAWFGWAWAGYRILRGRALAIRNIVPMIWVLVYFGWLGRIWVMTMRYYLPIYSAMAVLAAWAMIEMIRIAHKRGHDMALARVLLAMFAVTLGVVTLDRFNAGEQTMAFVTGLAGLVLISAAVLPLFKQRRAVVLTGFVALFTLLWGLMYTNIYNHQLTRVQAARWQFENISGDFSMQIDDAPEDTPIINIGLRNLNSNSAEQPSDLLSYATRLTEALPEFASFVAPADGTVSSVYAPHLGDPLDDPEMESIYISVSTGLEGIPLGTATLTADLTRDAHILGRSYTIPFDQPFTVEAGKTYTFKVESLAGSGQIISGGAVIGVEGPWDDRITTTQICQLPDGMTLADDPSSGLNNVLDCSGQQSRDALVQSYDMFLAHGNDDQLKYDAIFNGLEHSDYVTITSNRFYDAMSRNQLRWPMTMRYYEALFSGELGFELVTLFDETFEFGPLRVSDQHLPSYDSPVWLNELESDEAFNVYDHPAVFIFKKMDSYSTATTEYVLNSVSRKQPYEAIDLADVAGVVNWTSLDADRAPTQLQLTPGDREIQTEGGTWSDRFYSNSLLNTSQPVGVVAWWLVIMIFGWVTWPLLFVLLPGLADRGYGVAKFVGLLLVGWLAWLAASFHIPLWSREGIFLMLLTVAGISLIFAWRQRDALTTYAREHWRRILWFEVISLVLFLIFIGVRLTNPDLWHFGKGGEKPMDFGYFNAVLRSTVFPPLDPWYAGGYINYYYFGFVLVGSPVLLLSLLPAFAYNLIIPTLFSITGMGAFSAAFNIVDHWRERRAALFSGKQFIRPRLGNPWVAGVAALVLCVGVGNLDTIRVIGNGIAQLGGYTSTLSLKTFQAGLEEYLAIQYAEENNIAATEIPEGAAFSIIERAAENRLIDRLNMEAYYFSSLVNGLGTGIGKLLSGEPLPIYHDRWYWGPSRVIGEAPDVGGNAITEMPYFTFLYGDLHAHMINLPVLLFVIVFLWNEFALVRQDGRNWFEQFLALALGALVVGLIRAINTWDWPSFLGFALIGLTYFWWIRWNHTVRDLREAWGWGLSLAGFAIAFGVLHVLYSSQAEAIVPAEGLSVAQILNVLRLTMLGGIGLMGGWIAVRWILTRDSLIDFLRYVVGFAAMSFLFVLPYATWYAAVYNSVSPWQGKKTPLWAYLDIHGVFLFLLISLLIWETARWLRTVPVSVVRGKALWFYLGVGVTGMVLVASWVGSALDYQVAMIVLPLVLWIGILFFRPEQSRALRFVLVLAGLALALTLGVEVIVIDGDLGRQNTVFKFYMQTWVLFSVMGGVAASWLLNGSDYWSNRLRFLWYTPFMMLLVIAAMYPLMATRGRALDRFTQDVPLTLYGNEYMQYATYFDEGVELKLANDYAIIRWLQENVEGTPAIIEGRSTTWSEYRWNGRIAINTGLPSVLGWRFHQTQQRTFDPLPQLVDKREDNVQSFYSSGNIPSSVYILQYYQVRYVIVGEYDRAVASQEALDKFKRMQELGLLAVVFQNGEDIIYEVQPDQLRGYMMSPDYKAVDWMQNSVVGTPVVLEGCSLLADEACRGRVVQNTGLTTIHQYFEAGDSDSAAFLLHDLNVQYIVLTNDEQSQMSATAQETLDSLIGQSTLSRAYQVGDITVYQFIDPFKEAEQS